MEEINEKNTTITENIHENIVENDEELVSALADTLERPILNSKTKRPRSQAQIKAFAKARLALVEKRTLDRERKLAEKKPVGRPKKKDKVKEISPVESVPEESIKKINSNKKSQKKVTNMIFDIDNSSSSDEDDEIIYVRNKKKKKARRKQKREPTVVYISASSSESESESESDLAEQARLNLYNQQSQQRPQQQQQQQQSHQSFSDPFDSIQFV